MIFSICLITSWVEIGNGKKCYFQYHLNIHILSQFSNTLTRFWQGILICQNCDTLMCFHVNARCGGNFHIVELEVCQSCTYMTMFD
jgi:hypothetical protein